MSSVSAVSRGRAPRPLTIVTATATVALSVALSGCVSTEQKAAWVHVEDARIIASQGPVVVWHAGREARVTRVALLRTRGRVAIVVQLHNATSHALSDLPISVGLRRPGGARVFLNRVAGLAYFRTHVALIPAGSSVTWVFTALARRHATDPPFAVVGSEASPPITSAHTIPPVAAVLASATRAQDGLVLRILVSNRSSIPQTGLQVYATASSASRYAAAGSATIPNLGAGDSTTTSVRLVGRASRAQIRLEALPTMF